jgi:hypothetical protein
VTTLGLIASRARQQSPLWAAALRTDPDQRLGFGPIAGRYGLGVETIYEAFLVHYGRPRIFHSRGRDHALLLGDYLYAAGLVEVCTHGELGAVRALAELITRAAAGRGRGDRDDGALWLATARMLGGAEADGVSALALHAELT